MEYVRDHGHFADLPFDRIFTAYDQTYPNLFDHFAKKNQSDFSSEAEQENRG
jgi:hypothetical protein